MNLRRVMEPASTTKVQVTLAQTEGLVVPWVTVQPSRALGETRRCPLRVKSGRDALKFRCPLYPRKRTSLNAIAMSALGHVWTAPSWQGLSSRTQHWSVQPCVRPVDAVHMTAGHNALRGSGPGQKLALALVG